MRAAEEARGLVRWLRPEFQRGASAERAPDQPGIELNETVVARLAAKAAWPKDGAAQAKAIADLLAASPAALSRDDIAAFTAHGRWRERLDPLLDMLVVLGKARVEAGEVPRYRRGG